uniref:Uncharacterized protein n=1 Tax=Redbank virus TaxID=2714904 RepID=A0A6G7M5F7_9VIRU|nr:hypothetical protein [Redbank virus]
MMSTFNSQSRNSTQALFDASINGISRTGRFDHGQRTAPLPNKKTGFNRKPVWLVITDRYAASIGKPIISVESDNYAHDILNSRLAARITSRYETYSAAGSYTSDVNNWITASRLVHEKTTQRQTLHNGRRIWEYERNVCTPGRTLIAYGIGGSLKEAKHLSDYAMSTVYLNQAITQMDREGPKESVQGLANQDSDMASNTIVTRDEDQTVSSTISEVKALDYVSSEPMTSMEQITGRWMPLKFLEVKTEGQARGAVIATYYLPETLYTEMGKAPNLLPFETFIYGKYDIDMKFVVNANKFQCGKVVVAAKFDTYQADENQNTVQAALQRPHVILDMSTNVEGVLKVPFRYHRAMLRNVKNDASTLGVRPAKFATVNVYVLSPLSTGTDGLTNAFIRPFVKISKAEFTAMSYRVDVQMDTLVPVLKEALPTREVRDVLRTAEVLLKTVGETANRDKPSQVGATAFVPHPRLNFGTGKGLVDSHPLRNNPYAMTTFTHVKPFDDEPKTTLDVARIWGLRSVATWKADYAPGQTIATIVVDPSIRSYSEGYTGVPTPLEYICSMYQFWAGTIEFRIDFVSNSFHTGAVMLAAEFGRPVDKQTEKEIETASTYTKTFHLGDQKSVTFTVPYIYDTVWRRTNTLAFQPRVDKPTATDDLKYGAVGIRADSKTVFRIRVINDLRPVVSAPQDIEMLVYWRASPNFMVHGLKQMSMYSTREQSGTVPILDSFPFDGYKPTDDKARSKRSTEEGEVVGNKKDHDIPAGSANEWNERTPAASMKYHNDQLAKRHIRVQSDEGEKENEDPTQDFAIGRFNLGLQTTDSQVSIKDILRRPVLLFHRITVQGFARADKPKHGFFIPLMPPSREMQYHSKNTKRTFCDMVGQTPQAALMNMFRFWRGTMRYTVICETTNSIMYITHIPHSGTRCIGNKVVAAKAGSTTEVTERPIFAAGLSTDILVPSVNPTMVYEAPYDTENDWTLTFEEDPQRNYAWRDKGDTTAGHIVLSTPSDMTVSVWWSAGDDFEVANFYGTPSCSQDDHLYMYNDEHARVQMDFNFGNGSYLHGTISAIKGQLPAVALSAVPVVGPALAAGYAVNRATAVMDNVNETLDTARDAINDFTQTSRQARRVVSRADDLIEDLSVRITSCVESVIASLNVVPTIKTILESALFDLIAAYIDRSWTVIATGFCKIIYQIIGGSKLIFEHVSAIARCIRNMFTEQATAQADETATLVGLLCAIVGSALSVVIDARSFSHWMKEFGKIFVTAKGISYMNQVLRFVSTTFNCLKAIVLKALGLVDPEIEAIKSLSQNSELIREFVQEAQICMNEANSSLLHSPAFRLKFWKATLRAYQIQKSLALAGRNVASPYLAKMCNDVIKSATEKFVDLSCSPVRYEPFVLCIEGEPGIGKSYITHTIAKALMDAIGYTNTRSGLIFDRIPGAKFWSGYRDQPVIVYDDWMNLTSQTQLEETISELYKLKTTAAFRPEMAAVEEKKISANPTLVMLLCNGAWPRILNGNPAVAYPEAVLRRRDLVVRASLNPTFEARKGTNASIRSVLTEQESADMAHLQFNIATSATQANSYTSETLDYPDFIDKLKEIFLSYHQNEQKNVKRRLDITMDSFSANDGNLTDPFELLYSQTPSIELPAQNAYLPSEQLECAVATLCRAVERQMVATPAPEGPQVQIELGQFVYPIVAGVVLTPTVLAKIASVSWSTVIGSLEGALDTMAQRVGRCSVCMNEGCLLAIDCDNSTEENSHAVCQACADTAINLGQEFHSCPTCRSAAIGPALTHHGSALVKMAIWIVKNGRRYVEPLIRYFTNVAQYIPARLCATFELIASMVRYAYEPRQHLLARAASAAATAATDMVVRPSVTLWHDAQNIGLQADEDPVDNVPAPPQLSNNIDDILTIPLFREDLWDTYNAPMRTQCLHEHALENPRFVTYEYDPESDSSNWKYAMEMNGRVQYVYMPDGKCCDDCPFGNKEAVREFIYDWRRANISEIRRNVATAHNAMAERRSVYVNRIPRLLRPAWMEMAPIEVVAENWWDYLSAQYSKYATLINVCIGISTSALALLAAKRLWDSWDTPARNIQGADPNYNVEARQLRRVVQPRRLQPQRYTVNTQSESLDDIVRERVIRNYVIMQCYDADDKVVCRGAMVGLVGKVAIMPKHYVSMLARHHGQKITLEPALYMNGKENHLRIVYNYDAVDFTEMSNTDLAFFRLPNSYPSFRDIRNFIQTDADAAGPLPNEGEILLVPTRVREALMVKAVDILDYEPRQRFTDADDTTFFATDLLSYSHSEQGACGSLMMITGSQRPIKTMHVAGTSSGIGYGVILTRELLAELPLDKLSLQYEVVERETVEERPDAMVWDTETRVDYLGALPTGKVPFSPVKTKIRKSVIAPLLEPAITEPAILSSKDHRYTHAKSPLFYGTKKHGNTTLDFTTTQVEKARSALWDMLISPMKPNMLKPKRLTIKEAVLGFSNLTHYEPMRLDTSAGYPWQLSPRGSTKRAWITVDKDCHGEVSNYEIKDELVAEIVRKENMRKSGVIPETIFTDSLKDERKKTAKVLKAGGTRVFCACPVDYTIAMRQNLLHFCSAFMKARLNVCSAVGINAKGSEWTELYRRLTKVSVSNIINMDYSNFGPGFNAKVSEAAMNLMIDWTMKNVEGCNETELRALLMECTNSVHAAGATVYRQFAGSPSGAPITTIINTLVNLLYLTISWEALAGEQARKEHPDIYHVMRHYTAIVAYGDDFIASVHDKYAALFNTNTIRNYLATYKIAATSADKDLVVMPDFVPISKASFLKRTFRCHDTRKEMVLGPLDMEALSEIPKWIWECLDKKAATRVNVESALMEAHGYGPKFFDQFKQTLNDALTRKGIETVSMQWDSLDHMWFSDEMPNISVLEI